MMHYRNPTELDPDFTSYTGTDYQWGYRFTGRLLDNETGLQLNRNRLYHYELGKWIMHDPLGAVDGENLYAYVLNNPLAYFDPSGNIEVSNDDSGCCCTAELYASQAYRFTPRLDHLCIQVKTTTVMPDGTIQRIPWSIELLVANHPSRQQKEFRVGTGSTLGLGVWSSPFNGPLKELTHWGIYVYPYSRCLSVEETRDSGHATLLPTVPGGDKCGFTNCLVNMARALGAFAEANAADYTMTRNSNSFVMEVLFACQGMYVPIRNFDINRAIGFHRRFSTGEGLPFVPYPIPTPSFPGHPLPDNPPDDSGWQHIPSPPDESPDDGSREHEPSPPDEPWDDSGWHHVGQ